MTFEEKIQLIEALAKLWPLILIVIVVIFIIVFRKFFYDFFKNNRIKKIKALNAEVEFNDKEPIKVEEIENELDKKEDLSIENNLQGTITDGNLFTNYIEALTNRDFTKANELINKILLEEPDSDQKEYYLIYNFYERYIFGDLAGFTDFENYIIRINLGNYKIKDDNRAIAYHLFGLIYSKVNNKLKAIDFQNDALKLNITERNKARIIKELSELYFDINEEKQSFNLLTKYINELKDEDALANLYIALGDLYSKKELSLLKATAYEKAYELKPDKISYLFSSAYSFSEINSFNDLSLLLYDKYLDLKSDDDSAINNIGVTYSNLGMRIKSVNKYYEAFEKGNTLAGANLGNILLDVGFKNKTNKIIDECKKNEKSIHQNVTKLESRIQQAIDNESAQEKTVKERANKKLGFISKFASAAFSEKKKINESDNWYANQIEVKLKIENNKIEIKWNTSKETEHTINGIIINNVFNLKYTKPKYGILSSYVSYDTYEGYGFIFDSNIIKCYIIADNNLDEIIFTSKG